MRTDNVIENKSFDFAISIISLYKQLTAAKEYTLSRQLLKSGTSIGANVQEALAAQSPRDFINKLSISAKEARETKYWLLLLKKSQLVNLDYEEYLANACEIIRILTSIIKTTQAKLT